MYAKLYWSELLNVGGGNRTLEEQHMLLIVEQSLRPPVNFLPERTTCPFIPFESHPWDLSLFCLRTHYPRQSHLFILVDGSGAWDIAAVSGC